MYKRDASLLFLDDEPIVALSYGRRALDDGFGKAYYARDYAEALAIIHRFRIDLMIIDAFVYGFSHAGVDTYVPEYKFAVYAGNKYGVQHMYVPTIGKETTIEMNYARSKPLSILQMPASYTIFLDVVNRIVDELPTVRRIKRLRKVIGKSERLVFRELERAAQEIDLEFDTRFDSVRILKMLDNTNR